MDSLDGRNPEQVQRHMVGTYTYRKTTPVRARQMNRDFSVFTLEGVMRGHAGDYLVSDFEMTHAWPVRKDVFESTYLREGHDGYGMQEAQEYIERTFVENDRP